MEAGKKASAFQDAHARGNGTAREGHRCRTVDVRFLQRRRAVEGLREEIPCFRQYPAREEEMERGRQDGDAHRLSTIQRRHSRSAVCQWRERIPSWHSAEGD